VSSCLQCCCFCVVRAEPLHLLTQACVCLLCRGYDAKYKFGILPVSTFCSGHTFFTQRMHEKLKLQPYVVHATFQFSGTPGKRHRMREFMLWHVSAA
jgi:Nucleotide-diphospho-sugar transferase